MWICNVYVIDSLNCSLISQQLWYLRRNQPIPLQMQLSTEVWAIFSRKDQLIKARQNPTEHQSVGSSRKENVVQGNGSQQLRTDDAVADRTANVVQGKISRQLSTDDTGEPSQQDMDVITDKDPEGTADTRKPPVMMVIGDSYVYHYERYLRKTKTEFPNDMEVHFYGFVGSKTIQNFTECDLHTIKQRVDAVLLHFGELELVRQFSRKIISNDLITLVVKLHTKLNVKYIFVSPLLFRPEVHPTNPGYNDRVRSLNEILRQRLRGIPYAQLWENHKRPKYAPLSDFITPYVNKPHLQLSIKGNEVFHEHIKTAFKWAVETAVSGKSKSANKKKSESSSTKDGDQRQDKKSIEGTRMETAVSRNVKSKREGVGKKDGEGTSSNDRDPRLDKKSIEVTRMGTDVSRTVKRHKEGVCKKDGEDSSTNVGDQRLDKKSTEDTRMETDVTKTVKSKREGVCKKDDEGISSNVGDQRKDEKSIEDTRIETDVSRTVKSTTDDVGKKDGEGSSTNVGDNQRQDKKSIEDTRVETASSSNVTAVTHSRPDDKVSDKSTQDHHNAEVDTKPDCANLDQKGPANTRPPVMMIVGDAYVFHYWRWYLKNRQTGFNLSSPADVLFHAVHSKTIKEFTKDFLRRVIARHQPDVVVLQFGELETARITSVTRIVDDIMTMVEKLHRDYHVKYICVSALLLRPDQHCSNPSYNQRVHALHDEVMYRVKGVPYAGFCKNEKRSRYAPLHEYAVNLQCRDQLRHVPLSGQGHEIYHEHIRAALKQGGLNLDLERRKESTKDASPKKVVTMETDLSNTVGSKAEGKEDGVASSSNQRVQKMTEDDRGPEDTESMDTIMDMSQPEECFTKGSTQDHISCHGVEQDNSIASCSSSTQDHSTGLDTKQAAIEEVADDTVTDQQDTAKKRKPVMMVVGGACINQYMYYLKNTQWDVILGSPARVCWFVSRKRTIKEYIERELIRVKHTQPDVVLIHFGELDLSRQHTPVETVAEDLMTLVKEMHTELGVTYIYVSGLLYRPEVHPSNPEFNDRVSSLHDTLRSRLHDVPYAQFWENVNQPRRPVPVSFFIVNLQTAHKGQQHVQLSHKGEKMLHGHITKAFKLALRERRHEKCIEDTSMEAAVSSNVKSLKGDVRKKDDEGSPSNVGDPRLEKKSTEEDSRMETGLDIKSQQAEFTKGSMQDHNSCREADPDDSIAGCSSSTQDHSTGLDTKQAAIEEVADDTVTDQQDMAKKRKPLMMVVGGTYIYLYKHYLKRPLMKKFSLDHPGRVNNCYGVKSKTIQQFIKQDLMTLKSFQPDVILIHFGELEISMSIPVKRVVEDLMTLLKKMHTELHVTYILVSELLYRPEIHHSNPEYNDRVCSLNDILRSLLQAVPYAQFWENKNRSIRRPPPLSDYAVNLRNPNQEQHVRLSNKGHEMLHDHITRAFQYGLHMVSTSGETGQNQTKTMEKALACDVDSRCGDEDVGESLEEKIGPPKVLILGDRKKDDIDSPSNQGAQEMILDDRVPDDTDTMETIMERSQEECFTKGSIQDHSSCHEANQDYSIAGCSSSTQGHSTGLDAKQAGIEEVADTVTDEQDTAKKREPFMMVVGGDYIFTYKRYLKQSEMKKFRLDSSARVNNCYGVKSKNCYGVKSKNCYIKKFMKDLVKFKPFQLDVVLVHFGELEMSKQAPVEEVAEDLMTLVQRMHLYLHVTFVLVSELLYRPEVHPSNPEFNDRVCSLNDILRGRLQDVPYAEFWENQYRSRPATISDYVVHLWKPKEKQQQVGLSGKGHAMLHDHITGAFQYGLRRVSTGGETGQNQTKTTETASACDVYSRCGDEDVGESLGEKTGPSKVLMVGDRKIDDVDSPSNQTGEEDVGVKDSRQESLEERTGPPKVLILGENNEDAGDNMEWVRDEDIDSDDEDGILEEVTDGDDVEDDDDDVLMEVGVVRVNADEGSRMEDTGSSKEIVLGKDNIHVEVGDSKNEEGGKAMSTGEVEGDGHGEDSLTKIAVSMGDGSQEQKVMEHEGNRKHPESNDQMCTETIASKESDDQCVSNAAIQITETVSDVVEEEIGDVVSMDNKSQDEKEKENEGNREPPEGNDQTCTEPIASKDPDGQCVSDAAIQMTQTVSEGETVEASLDARVSMEWVTDEDIIDPDDEDGIYKVLVAGHGTIRQLETFLQAMKELGIEEGLDFDGAKVELRGVEDGTIQQFLEKDFSYIAGAKPEVVVLQLGELDLAHHDVSPPTVAANLIKVVRKLHCDIGVRFIVLGQALQRLQPPHTDDSVKELNALLEQDLEGLPYAAFWKHRDLLKPECNVYHPDGVQWNDVGLFILLKSFKEACVSAVNQVMEEDKQVRYLNRHLF